MLGDYFRMVGDSELVCGGGGPSGGSTKPSRKETETDRERVPSTV